MSGRDRLCTLMVAATRVAVGIVTFWMSKVKRLRYPGVDFGPLLESQATHAGIRSHCGTLPCLMPVAAEQ